MLSDECIELPEEPVTKYGPITFHVTVSACPNLKWYQYVNNHGRSVP